MVQSQDAYVDSGFRKSPVEKERGGGLYAVFALFVIVFFSSFRFASKALKWIRKKKTALSRFFFVLFYLPFLANQLGFSSSTAVNQLVLFDTILLMLLAIIITTACRMLYMSSKAPLLFYYFITFAPASVPRPLLYCRIAIVLRFIFFTCFI